MGYNEILDKEPSLERRRDAETTQDDIYFVGPQASALKARFALRHGLGGVMIWELGQDRPLSSGMLADIHRALSTPLSEMSWNEVFEAVMARSPVSEDQVFMGLTAILGGYLMIRVLVGRRRWDSLLPPRKPEEPRELDVPTNVDGDTAIVTKEPIEEEKKPD